MAFDEDSMEVGFCLRTLKDLERYHRQFCYGLFIGTTADGFFGFRMMDGAIIGVFLDSGVDFTYCSAQEQDSISAVVLKRYISFRNSNAFEYANSFFGDAPMTRLVKTIRSHYIEADSIVELRVKLDAMGVAE